MPRWPEVPSAVVGGLSGNVVWTGAMTAVLALSCAALVRFEGARRLSGGLLVALEFGALMWAHEPLYVLAPAELLETPPPFAEHVRQSVPPGEPVRVVTSVRSVGPERSVPGLDYHGKMSLAFLTGMLPDTTTLWGIESANGYMPGENVRVRRLREDLAHWLGQVAPRLATPFSVHSAWGGGELVLPPSARVVAEDPLFETKLVVHPEAVPKPEFVIRDQAGEQAGAEEAGRGSRGTSRSALCAQKT
ncbi:hypothetical protein HUA78_27775 [Myxococcus sp. CA033]|nr:hypothetical protein [Myxococcus sp. CA033]